MCISKNIKKAAISKRFNNFRFLLSLDLTGFREREYGAYNQLVQTIQKDKWIILSDKKTRIENKIAAVSLLFGIHGLRILYKVKKGMR